MGELPPTQNRTTEMPVQEDVWLHSACEMCYASCGILIHRINGVVVKIEGDPECPHNLGKQCAKGQAAIMTLYNPNRVKTPLRRTNPEKGMGVDPKWEAISWEEALTIVCERLKKIREDDPRKLLFSSWDIYLKRITHAWQDAFGLKPPMSMVPAMRCGAGLHVVTYLTNGTFHNDVDLEYCNYLILFGSQLGFLAGVNPMPMAGKMAEARARGMKLVVIDPRCSNAAAKADEWIPIRPGTDGAMALAMLHVLLNERGLYDQEFLKKHTNACYLVGPDGKYVRDKETNKPLVWDSVEAKAKTFDAEVQDSALEGSYSVQGVECRPAFYLLKEQVKEYTPEQVSAITSVPAATIRRIAQEYGEAAKIGSKIVIDGQELPYRPAGVHYYKGVVASGQATWQQLSILLLNFAVGSFYSPGGYNGVDPFAPPVGWTWTPGAPGGGARPTANEDGLILPAERISQFNAYAPRKRNPSEGDRSLLLRGVGGGLLGFYALSDPQEYKPSVTPEAAIICRNNWAMSRENKKQTFQGLLNIPFIVSFCTVLDETAEFADIVLPDAAIMERLIPFPNSERGAFMAPVTGHFYWGVGQRVSKPAGEARHWCDVLLEIADRMGFLEDFYDQILSGAEPAYKLDPKKKYSVEEILDRLTKSHFGPERGLEWFKEHGYMRIKMNVEERYPILSLKPRVPIYYEHFLRGGEECRTLIKERNITGWDTSSYAAVPQWKPSPAYEKRLSTEYDLFCINYTPPIYFKTISPENAWLSEIGERHPSMHKIEIYTEAAKRRGIKDGDLVWVESIAGKVRGTARVTECIHPDAVAICGTLGSWAKGKPIARGKGVNHNSLIPVSNDRIDPLCGAIDQCVEVKVYKAEGEKYDG